MTAYDYEDGDLTGNITIAGEVNTNLAGIYELNYFVTDSDGNTATFRRAVIVNDGSFVLGENHIIQARGFIRRVSEVDTSSEAVLAASSARAYRITEENSLISVYAYVLDLRRIHGSIRKIKHNTSSRRRKKREHRNRSSSSNRRNPRTNGKQSSPTTNRGNIHPNGRSKCLRLRRRRPNS